MVLPAAEEKDTEPAAVTESIQPEVQSDLNPAGLRRQRRLELSDQMAALSQAGLPKSAIARQLKLSGNTVLRWLRPDQFPERTPRHGMLPKITEFAEYLSQRWKEGCHNAIVLHREVRESGFGGTYWGVARLLAKRRKNGVPKPSIPECVVPTQAAILVTRWSNELTDQQQQLLDRLTVHLPAVTALRKVALGFRTALQSTDSKLLQQWIERAPQSGFGPIVRFVDGLQKDIAAVTAAADTDWSNGQTEGQINRLKTIKRQLYGRAGFALLRARVLPYCPAFTATGPSS